MALADELTERKRVKIGNSCINEPVYLQWLNNLSGISYWLFGVLNIDTVDTKENGYYEKYVADLSTAQGNDGIISKSNELAKVVGASVPKEDMDGLTGLFISPKVKMLTNADTWVADGAKWQDVRIKQGSMVVAQTRKDFYDVSFEILLPKQYVISE